MRQKYLRQMDDGKWLEATVEFRFDSSTGQDVGEVVDANIYDEMPEIPEELIIYKAPAN